MCPQSVSVRTCKWKKKNEPRSNWNFSSDFGRFWLQSRFAGMKCKKVRSERPKSLLNDDEIRSFFSLLFLLNLFFFGGFSIDEYRRICYMSHCIVCVWLWMRAFACVWVWVRVSEWVNVYVCVCARDCVRFVHRESKYIPYGLCRVIVSWLCKFKGVIWLNAYTYTYIYPNPSGIPFWREKASENENDLIHHGILNNANCTIQMPIIPNLNCSFAKIYKKKEPIQIRFYYRIHMKI